MKKIIPLILLGCVLSWDNPPAFKNSEETTFDSLYNRYTLLMLEVHDVRKSLYELQKSFENISDIADTTDNIKDKLSLLEKKMAYEIKKMNKELYKERELIFVQDSTNATNISDLEDRFFTFRSTSKNGLKRLKEDNARLKYRQDDLENRIKQLEKMLRYLEK